MNRYGEAFDKALTIVQNVNFKKRRIAIITLAVVCVISYFVIMILMYYANTTSTQSNPTLLMISISATANINTFSFIALLVVALNRSKQIRIYKNVVRRTCDIAKYMGENDQQLEQQFEACRQAKDTGWILHTVNTYYDKCEEMKAIRLANPDLQTIEYNGEGKFDGGFLQMLGWMLLCTLITVCTIGIAFPLAYVIYLKWQTKHTLYNGKRLSFDGTTMQLIGKWICWLLLCIPTLGIFAWFIPKKLLQWKAKHTHINGEMPFLGGTWEGSALGLFFRNIGYALLNALTFSLLIPVTMCWKNQYVQSHLILDGRKTYFDGTAGQIYLKWLLGMLLSIVTLGIYGIVLQIQINNWISQHTHFEEGYVQAKVL